MQSPPWSEINPSPKPFRPYIPPEPTLDPSAQESRRSAEEAALADSLRVAEQEAEAHRQVIEEERAAVESMPNGPKKMLKMKALKAARLKAGVKMKEAAALRELRQEYDDTRDQEVAVPT